MNAEEPTAPQRGMERTGGNAYPVPDPTVLTTQQLHREILAVREILEARLNGMDKAIVLIQAAVDKSPTIAEIYAEFKEKFNSVQSQFRERDVRSEQTQKDSKVAVDAALQAAKEAVGEQNKSSALAISKSEGSTTKQIDQIGTSIKSMETNFNDKIGDIKDRLNTFQLPITNSLSSLTGHSRGANDMWGWAVAAAGLFFGLVAAAATIALVFKK